MASARTTRTVKVKFDGDEKGLIAAAAKAGIAMEAFEKQAKKSTVNVAQSTSLLGGGLVDALGSLPSVLKGAAIVAAVGIGAVMAPALASAIISGVLLAVGAGVLAAGIIGAAKSPKVKKAWEKFGRQAEVVFERFSKPFIKPLEKAAQTFAFALAKAEPTIRRIGATMAPIIDKLAPAFAGMAEQALPGILAAAQAAVPLFETLAANLPGIGGSLALFFQTLAGGVPAAQIFFDGFLKWVQDILPKLGGFLVWLSDLGVKMDSFAKGPEIAGLKAALIDFKDNALAGISSGFDKVKISLQENSATWKQMGKDISAALGEAGPAVKWFVESTAASLGFIINVWARLYDILHKVYVMIQLVTQGYNRLPGNLSGNGTHVQFGNLPGRAYGGPVTSGRSYMVGERAPEIFTPRQSGYITPLSQANAGGGMPPIEVNVMVELDGEPVGRRVRTEISEHNRGVKRGVAMAGAR